MTKILIIGSICTILLLVFMSFSSVVDAAEKSVDERISFIQQIAEKKDGTTDTAIEIILALIVGFLGLISAFSIFLLLYMIGDVSY